MAVWRQNNLACFSLFWVLFKCGHYSIEKPTRELLFTAVPSELKFSVKSFIDTFIYKAGRALAGLAFGGMVSWGVTDMSRMVTAVAVCLAWGGVGAFLCWCIPPAPGGAASDDGG